MTVQKGDWKKLFIEALAGTGIVLRACEAAGISRTTVYEHKKSDPQFAKDWDDAAADATELLEEEARRRAYRGVDRPVYQGGQLVGHVTEYSDTLLIFLLKGNNPRKFKERYEHSGPDEGPIPVAIKVDDEQARLLHSLLKNAN